MNHNLLILFLISHLLGDYYLQNDQLANSKNGKIKPLMIHFAIYLGVSLLIILPIWSWEVLLFTGMFILAHSLIDLIKYIYFRLIKHFMSHRRYKDYVVKTSGAVYIVDQVCHVVSILGIVYVYYLQYGDLSTWSLLNGRWQMDNLFLRYILMILLLLKPVNITFRKLFMHTKPEDDDEEEAQDHSAGKIVGNLERLLILVLLSLNQFTAIGLVFTAKSITRYDKISKEKAFAEYYLLGTLFSLLATLVLYLVILS